MTAPGSRIPALVPIALEAFEAMKGPNQLSKRPDHVPGRDEMLELHTGPRTEQGARENIRVGVQYLAAWLGGKGAVPLYNLMEDAATAEISRAAAVAMAALRSAARRRPQASPASCSTRSTRKRSACCRKSRTSPTPPSCSAKWSSQTTSPNS